MMSNFDVKNEKYSMNTNFERDKIQAVTLVLNDHRNTETVHDVTNTVKFWRQDSIYVNLACINTF